MAKDVTEILVEVTHFLNNIIKTQGEILPNNHAIWNTYLHKWSNDDWNAIFATLLALCNTEPTKIKDYQKTALIKARNMFLSRKNTNDRCMDTKELKKYAWNVLMMIREIINQLSYTPAVKATPKHPKVTTEHYDDKTVVTMYHNLFEEE